MTRISIATGFFPILKNGFRLLYVDTPELSESHKGKDPKHGLTAKAFLKSALLKGKAALRVDTKNKKGDYGRLVAILEVRGYNVQSGSDQTWPQLF